jgi:hypothetical protein
VEKSPEFSPKDPVFFPYHLHHLLYPEGSNYYFQYNPRHSSL